jgi:hypothetical protein
MKRTFCLTTCLAVLLAALPCFAGEIIDGVVASVNRHPILLSDWDEAVRFEAFMQQKPVSTLGQAERCAALLRLIDRQLLTSQMGDAGYMQPSEERLQQDLTKLRAQLPDGKDDAAWQRLLASYGLSESAVKQHLRHEVQVMNFIEVRLRPNVHVNEDEVAAYYREQLVPDLQKTGGKILPIEEVKDRIHELLTEQRIDEVLEAWMHNLRQQAEIRSRIPIPGVNAPERERPAGSN